MQWVRQGSNWFYRALLERYSFPLRAIFKPSPAGLVNRLVIISGTLWTNISDSRDWDRNYSPWCCFATKSWPDYNVRGVCVSVECTLHYRAREIRTVIIVLRSLFILFLNAFWERVSKLMLFQNDNKNWVTSL